MQMGLKAALSTVAAVGFLTGVAVAECPDFSSGVPSVIITDKTTVSGEFDPPPTTSSQNLFVFDGAFTLSNYIDLGSESVGDVKFLFVEYQDADDTTPQTGSGAGGAWITIGGQFGEATEPTGTDIRSTGQAVNVPLDFRNEFLSPSPDSLPYPDPNPDYIDANTSGTRVITVFIAGANIDCDSTPTLASFDVITSKSDPADGLTGAVSIFTPEESYGTVPPNAATFENWQFLDLGADLGGDPALRTPNIANAAFAPANTNSISVGSTTDTAGDAVFGDWKKGMTTSLVGGSLYRLRATVTTDIPTVAEPLNTATNLANQSVAWRFRFGNQFATDDAYAALQYNVSSSSAPNATDGTVEVYAWHAPKSNSGTNPDAIDFEYVDIATTLGGAVPANFGHNVTLDQLVLESTSRALLLSGATVLVNSGGAVSSPDGVTPPASPTAFDVAWTNLALGDGGAMTVTATNNGSNLAMQFACATTTGLGLGIWNSPAVAGANGKVYVADIYLNVASLTANGANRNPLPDVILRFGPNDSTAFNHGQLGAHVLSLRTDNNHDGTTDNASGLTLSNTRVYTVVFQPRFNATVQPDTDMIFAAQFGSGPDLSTSSGANATINIERVVIQELNAPN